MTTQVTTQQIEERLFDALAELGPAREDIKREATLQELDIDSLDLVEISQIAEEEWGVELKSEDVTDLKTVGECLDLILARVG